MPTVIVEGPKIPIEKKRQLVEGLTQVASEIYGIDKKHIIILIRENPPENVGVGGKLLSERIKIK